MEDIRQREAWFLFAILWILVEVDAWVLIVGERMFPGFLSRFSSLYVATFTDLFVLLYCMRRFGRIELQELCPRRGDWLVVGLGGIAIFGYFGLTVGREGMITNTYDAIRDLPGNLYWLAVVNIAGIGPLFEESIFRRYFLEILRRHYSTAMAVFITAIVATSFHYGLPARSLIFIFFAQLLFTVLYVTSRLGVSVLIHMFMNSLVIALSR